VLKWIFERCDGGGAAVETPIGLMPTADAIDRNGLEGVEAADMEELLPWIGRPGGPSSRWSGALRTVRRSPPPELGAQLAALEARLSA
jgi:phosphoenolpyruvate carboxykinase (GTP)